MGKNLSPIQDKAEAQRRGRNGGKKSGEARRQKKVLRERLELLLEARHGDMDTMDTADALALALIEKGLAGDVRAFEVIRDTIGEKPTDKVAAANSAELVVRWEGEVSSRVAQALEGLEAPGRSESVSGSFPAGQ